MKIKIIFILVLMVLLPGFGFKAEGQISDIDANTGQRLKSPLVIAIDKNYPPQTLLDVDGQPAGLFVDIWRLWSQKTGKEISFIVSNWNDTLINLKSGKADIHSGLFHSDSRARWIGFSQPFYGVGSHFFFSAESNGIDSRGNLAEKRIGVTLGSFQEEYLREKYPHAEVITYTDREAMIRAALSMEIDSLLVEGPAMTAALNNLGLSGQFESSRVLFKKSFHSGVLKENNSLILEIDKGFSKISDKELAQIEKRWIPDPDRQYFKSSPGTVKLTEKEKGWLKNNPLIRARVGSVPPLHFFDGKYKGMSIDYLNLIAERVGFQVKYITDIPWPDALDHIKNHETIDLLLTAKITQERKEHMAFTDNYLLMPWVIFSKTDAAFISGLEDLNGKTVSVERGFVIQKKLEHEFPDIKLLITDNSQEAIEAVSSGDADAYVGNLTIATYIIQQNNLNNIKVAAPAPFDNHNQAMVIRNDWPELVSIINKTLKNLTPEEHADIRSRWMVFRYEYGISKGDILKWILAITIFSFTIVMVILFWSRKLKKEVLKRQKSKIDLKKSEEKFRRIFDNLQDGYLWGDSDGKLILANKMAADILGYDLKDLMQKNFAQDIYFDPEEREIVKKIMFKTGRIENYELAFKRKDGQKIIVEANSHLVYDDNHQGTMEGTFRDITARKQAEQEKIKAWKIAGEQKKLALVGQIAGKMAHDFNNILGIIMGNTELSLIDCKDAETRKTLQSIFEQTLKGKNLTRNLVAFAKDQEPKQEFFRLSEKIDLVLNLMKKDLEDISIIKDDKSNVPDMLADPGMIEHALVNLLQNSIHATSMSEHPRIILRTYCRNENIYFEIEDNGCGIPDEHLEKIYEPSFTLKGSQDRAGSYKHGIKGTGYGMANVKKYIEQHNGSIAVDSKSGVGTKFTICMPIIRKELTLQEKAEIQEGKQHFDKYILLVEDEPAISGVQYRILSQEPCSHKVDIAHDGQTALDLFERNNYDFVSLDYVLPGKINGMDVYDYIRKTNKTIPILFVSGNIEFLESIKELNNKDSNIDHLSKPCQNKDYVSSINKLLEKTLTVE